MPSPLAQAVPILLFALVAVLSILFHRLYPQAKYGVPESSD